MCNSEYNQVMPWKDKEKQRAAIRRHYYANKSVYIKKAMVRKKKIRLWLNAVKESSACTDCGVYYPYYVMDYDHVKDKASDISKLLNSCSMPKITAEIAKCELVCSNCHRQRTFNRLERSKL